MKKAISLIICFVMIASLVSVVSVSATVYTGECGENTTWTYDSETKTLTISGTGSTADYLGPDPSVPEFYYRAKPWDSYVGEIESVVVEAGVTRVGDAVLLGYPALTSVNIAGSVTALGKNNISDCPSLTSLTLPEGLEVLGANSVSICRNLAEVYLPSTLREVHWCALMYLNDGLQTIDDVKDINIYFAGSEAEWNAVDFCDADYGDGGINWTKIWLQGSRNINVIMHYNYSPEPPVKRGDVNSDGVITIKDLSTLKKVLASQYVEYSEANADLNGDGIINMMDIKPLRSLIAGIE